MSEYAEAARTQVLRRMAEGGPATDILNELCLAFEANVPGTKAGVTILDRTLRSFESATFPSLAPTYAEALKGILVADKPGSCALAVFEGRTVISTDVAGDTRFAPLWKELGAQHGLEALVSIPVMGSDKKAVGTFVVAYPPKTGLNRDDLRAADEFAEVCGLVLNRRRGKPTMPNPAVPA